MAYPFSADKRLTLTPLKRLMLVLSVLCSLVPLTALSAASFDCAKAKSGSAKLICSDTALSALDERLGDTSECSTPTLYGVSLSEVDSSDE